MEFSLAYLICHTVSSPSEFPGIHAGESHLLPRARSGLLEKRTVHKKREIVLDPLTLITEIKPLASTHFAGEQHQRLPFAQGQLLQGVIRPKTIRISLPLKLTGTK